MKQQQNRLRLQMGEVPSSASLSEKKKKNRGKCLWGSGPTSGFSIPNEDNITDHFRQCSSLSAELGESQLRAAVERTLLNDQSNTSSVSLPQQGGRMRILSHLKPHNSILPLRRKGAGERSRSSRTRSRRSSVTGLKGRRSIDVLDSRAGPSESTSSEDEVSNSREVEDNEPMDACLCFNSRISHQCQQQGINTSRSLSEKYQPKHFEDIIGHEINIKALCNAIYKAKIAPLYLFHGPRGTGKSSTAKIFAMASNCDSSPTSISNPRPCWSCKGCSRSLYILELCSGSRNSGFERARTLLQNTALTRCVSGLKVFIIEECHLLVAEAWDELLSIVDSRGFDYGGSVAFVLITDDMNSVPRAVSSRCQKFSFPKLKGADIFIKLARIAVQEDIRLDKDALTLITAKAEGSLREAVNILEQMALVGSKITASMVQQLVGLVPHAKLIGLLDIAMSADAIRTARCTRELLAMGVPPQSLVCQLASLITDILSGSSSLTSLKDRRLSRNQSELEIDRSQRLCHALKILVDTEKHLQSSSDHATWVVAALLEIASNNMSSIISTDIVLPKDIISTEDKTNISSGQNSNAANTKEVTNLVHQSRTKGHHLMNGIPEQPKISIGNDGDTSDKRIDNAEDYSVKMGEKPNWTQLSDMDDVWQNILERIHSKHMKEFLLQHGKLISLTVSRANAIVHLLFKRQEDKLTAEMSEETISKAFVEAFGCPVTVNMSLLPTQLEEIDRKTASSGKNQVADPSGSKQDTKPFLPTFEQPYSPDGKGILLKRSASHTSASISQRNFRPQRLQDGIKIFQGYDEKLAQNLQIPTFSGILAQRTRDDECIGQEGSSIRNLPHAITPAQLKHRWLSISSIQQGDASVEPYSQDLLFENAHIDGQQGTRRKPETLYKDLSVKKEHHEHGEPSLVLRRSWSCTGITCRDRAMVKKGSLVDTMSNFVLSLLGWTPCKDSSSIPVSEGKKSQLHKGK